MHGIDVYDPATLTKQQLMELLRIGPQHRIVAFDDTPYIVDWDQLMETNDFLIRTWPTSGYVPIPTFDGIEAI